MQDPADPTLTLPVAARFAFIMNRLMAVIAARVVQRDVWTGEMARYVWERVGDINREFQRLAALILSGKLPKERAYRPRPDKDFSPAVPPPDPARPKKPGIWRNFPHGKFAWLCGMMPSIPGLQGPAAYADSLRRLLEHPDMRALVAASPRMYRLLLPLLKMLGLEASLLGDPPPPRPRRPRKPRPPRPPRPPRQLTSRAAIMRVINERPGPIHGRGGPPFLPGELSRGGFSARTVREMRGQPLKFSKSE